MDEELFKPSANHRFTSDLLSGVLLARLGGKVFSSVFCFVTFGRWHQCFRIFVVRMRSTVPCRKCATKCCKSGFVFKNIEGKCVCRVCYASLKRKNESGEASVSLVVDGDVSTAAVPNETRQVVIDLEKGM